MTAAEGSSGVLWAVAVLEALNDLNGVDRAALRLIYWSGMTQSQVALELHLPGDAIRQCVARGMHELTAHLAAAADGAPS